MFKEAKGLEYTIEVLNVLRDNDVMDARGISHVLNKDRGMDSSPTYLSKMLRRMVKIGLLASSDKGYRLAVDLDTVTVGKVLQFSVDPLETNQTISNLTAAVVKQMDTIPLSSIYKNAPCVPNSPCDNGNSCEHEIQPDNTGIADSNV